MFSRKLLLIALFTAFGMAGLMAQANVHAHGNVVDSDGNLMEDINILISAIYSDSTVVFESVNTDPNGDYAVDFPSPGPNLTGWVQISMVDCFGATVAQWFTVVPGPNDIEADFVYCENIVIDSCAVYILEEWNPGALPVLTAYINANVQVEYQWSTGETTQSIIPNQAGIYCVDVIFPWGCVGNDCYSYVDSFNICYGYIFSFLNNDGTYNLLASAGGVAPFTYQWSNGMTTPNLYNVPAGTYCVTMTDATGCSYSTCTVLNPFFCTVAIASDPATNSLTAIGNGVEPITYYWNTGESGQTIYPTIPGVYCVTAYDTTGCSATACIDWGINPDSCFVYIVPVYIDSNTVGLQAIPGFYGTFLWNTGDTLDVIYPIDPTLEYCVTATDPYGCVSTACYDNSQSCYAWAEVQYIDTNTAVLTVYADPIFGGGTNTVTYLWSNGDTTQTTTVSESGSYCVTATMSSNCVAEACVYVDFDSLQYSCATWVTQFQDPVTNEWFAQAYSWGYGTFSYLWSNGDTNSVTQLNSPNEFLCVTAISSFGCVSEACVDTFFNPCQVYIDIAHFNGGAVLTATSWYGGAVNQGTYTWSNGQTGSVLTVINDGYYCVTFNSFSGCSSTACVQIYINIADTTCGVWVSVVPSPLGIIYTANNWGTPPFTYLWSNGSTEQIQTIDLGDPNVCVTVTDAIGCIATACAFDTISGGSNSINGYVSADSLSELTAKVFLYSVNSNNGEPFELLDSTQTGDYGYYTFNNLANGAYLVKAQLNPGSVGYEQFLPTYHVSSTTWEEANPSLIPNWLPITTDIWMQHVTGTPGGGIIGGGVQEHGIVAGGGEPRDVVGVPNVEVILKNEAGEPLDFVFTSSDGSFRFPELAYGTYRISYDIPGVHSPDVWVTILVEDPERLQVTLVVDLATTSVDQPAAQVLNLYPNPAKDQINIIMPVNHATYDIQIVNMEGRKIFTGSVESFNGIIPVEVGHFSPGLFHINLKGDNQNYYSRFLKLE
ncbi:MAG TPA: T9SS type A sorting domain-containing protein [Saprospiraceae bacterium]|nr:T9SS type A sorting domain-containing protein [Saprospiraceae bacterium]